MELLSGPFFVPLRQQDTVRVAVDREILYPQPPVLLRSVALLATGVQPVPIRECLQLRAPCLLPALPM